MVIFSPGDTVRIVAETTTIGPFGDSAEMEKIYLDEYGIFEGFETDTTVSITPSGLDFSVYLEIEDIAKTDQP